MINTSSSALMGFQPDSLKLTLSLDLVAYFKSWAPPNLHSNKNTYILSLKVDETGTGTLEE